MDLCNATTPHVQAALQSIASKLREIVQDGGYADDTFVTETSAVSRVLRGTNHKVSTLVNIAHELGYDVVFHFRERPVAIRQKEVA
jgi:hypothetical protein